MNEPPNESNETNPEVAPQAKSSPRIYILLGILVVIGGLWAMTLPAQSQCNSAKEKAEKIGDNPDDDPPLALMKAIGKTPMVKEDGDTMIQVYRWTGGIKIYELRVKFGSIFKDKKGIYGDPQDIQISSKPFFMTSSLEGYTEAHAATGTTYTKLTDLGEAELSSESGEIGEDEHDPGPGAGRPSGGKGRSLGPPEELKLTDDQKTKWTAASAKRSENLSGLRELSREERGAKYQEARDAFQAELEKFLTEEQMKQYEKISSERRSQWKGKGSGSGKSRPGPGKETP